METIAVAIVGSIAVLAGVIIGSMVQWRITEKSFALSRRAELEDRVAAEALRKQRLIRRMIEDYVEQNAALRTLALEKAAAGDPMSLADRSARVDDDLLARGRHASPRAADVDEQLAQLFQGYRKLGSKMESMIGKYLVSASNPIGFLEAMADSEMPLLMPGVEDKLRTRMDEVLAWEPERDS